MNIYNKKNHPIGYYIYAYIRSNNSANGNAGTPYYIGKGIGGRAWSKNHRINIPNKDTNIIILESNLTELGAHALERRLIRWFGKIIDNTGILHNICDGGEGVSGFVTAKHIITNEKVRVTVQEFHKNEYYVGATKGIPSPNKGKSNPFFKNKVYGKCATTGTPVGLISVDDIRYKTGEIIFIHKGITLSKIPAKCALTGKSLGAIDKSDPRWKDNLIVHPSKGKIVSEETKHKMKLNHKDQHGTNNTFYNKKHSEESKKKIGSRDYSSISGGNHVFAKSVQINGIIYDSVKSASRKLNISDNSLRGYLKQRRNLNDDIWEAFYI